jgi:hypothetical protein
MDIQTNLAISVQTFGGTLQIISTVAAFENGLVIGNASNSTFMNEASFIVPAVFIANLNNFVSRGYINARKGFLCTERKEIVTCPNHGNSTFVVI